MEVHKIIKLCIVICVFFSFTFFIEARNANGDDLRLIRYEFDNNNDGTIDLVSYLTNDANGNITKQEIDSNNDGTIDWVHNHTFDTNGNLTKHEYDNNNDGTIDGVTYYTNDANGNLIKRETDGHNDGTIDSIVYYIYERITFEVAIDIKPGSEPNSINVRSSGNIPVAILSSDTFDATTVNPDTVALAGARVKMVGKSGKYLSHIEDVNGDGLLDLVCQVYTAQFMIEPGETEAVLEAETLDGQSIRGTDNIQIVPDN